MKGFQLKNSLHYLKCVLRLSCVVHGPIYGRFMGFYVNGFLSIEIGFFFPYKSSYFECYATMPMLADAHISSLGLPVGFIVNFPILLFSFSTTNVHSKSRDSFPGDPTAKV